MRLFNEQGQYIKTAENLPIYSKSAGGFYTDNFKYLSNAISRDLVTFFNMWISNNYDLADKIEDIKITSLYRDPNIDPYPSRAHSRNVACDFYIRPHNLMPYFFCMLHKYFNWRIGISLWNYHIHVDHLEGAENGGVKFVEIGSFGANSVFNNPDKSSTLGFGGDAYDKLEGKVLSHYAINKINYFTSDTTTLWEEHVPVSAKLNMGADPASNTAFYQIKDTIKNLPSSALGGAWNLFGNPQWIIAGLVVWTIYRKSKGKPVIPPSLKRKINQLTAKKKTA
ncbi:MAG TPA: hypothetical protein PLH15_02470 [Spirochaetota bacterium]|nr:hypothetical protein [Spirochaetota bacterium]HPA64156.1 hypothetical protein [Spirochaetota bacterium]HQE57585.1 hypothetical protein [Spirochaetota bacterium]HQQ22685.1 hypothetical protein [Spirochaetota bacterium]